ncbi:NAD(P)/FAD-dependent oxidoreductase [Bradyrhizobium sp.]|uniref:flavin-containing monooxygenase n=1 Tax=Bradyrhizobium sp. TaxID=376 RepID=UPI002732BFE4|nr:FAD-dependent oxidoreductase [Bradyrhizobium sp.]MDP3694432.1 FAD-dependent oxidoreductase [Bradyrhizobium sp.]
MLERIKTSAEAEARSWIADFGCSLASGDAAAVAALFVPDCHWRNLCGISWEIATFSGAGKLADELCQRARKVGASGLDVDTELLVPRRAVLAGQEVIEAIFRFETANGPAIGVVRLLPSSDAAPKAWTLSTLLDVDRISATKSGNIEPATHNRDFAKQNWLEQRRTETAFEGREPDVLVVGGGHAGISAAVELKRLGLDTLVIDRQQRVGDNWRLRYHGLKLHNKTPVNHLRYMPFPPNWPDYIPKDKIANWLEAYVESMEVNFWTDTVFEGAEYNGSTQTWMARIQRGNGSVRLLYPKHIVMATSVSGTPNIPTIPTIEKFVGKVLHSSQFAAGAQWRGKSVVVMGTGTSAHDICQELQANGADVTMVQRSPTLVVNVDPSAQLYDKTYLGNGPPVEVRDLLNASVPLEVVKASHRLITREVRELDAPLLSRLERAGFRLEFGEDGTGWPLKFRTRGGGYYFNVGCSELIADGKIRLIQASDIRQFVGDGLLLGDGSTLQADLVVLATGYKGQDHIVGSLFGAEVAARVGSIWGFDADTQELRNMWSRTKQPGLWFTGGSFSQCRIYSRFLALQVDAIEHGRLDKAS